MDFDKYAEIVNETAVYPVGASVLYPLLALGEEVGEVQSIFAKHLRDRGQIIEGESGRQYSRLSSLVLDEEERAKVRDELGDILWEWAALCIDLGFPLSEVAQRNIIKLRDRKERGVLHGSGDNR